MAIVTVYFWLVFGGYSCFVIFQIIAVILLKYAQNCGHIRCL